MDLGTHLIGKTVPKFRCCTHISTIAWCFLCYMAFGGCSMRPLLLDLKLYAPSCCNLTNSCRYIGPCPLIALKVIMINLNCILSWTGNQCSSRRTGVIRYIFGILKIILDLKIKVTVYPCAKVLCWFDWENLRVTNTERDPIDLCQLLSCPN